MSVTAKKTIRSVKDIRTHSGSVDQTAIPYKAYMRISCLEMEKARRLNEKNQAMVRVKLIDKRIMEIEAEKKALKNTLARLEEAALAAKTQKTASDKPGRPLPRRGSGSDNDTGGRLTEGFKIRY